MNAVNIGAAWYTGEMPGRSPLARRAKAKPAGRYHHGDLRRALLDATLAIVLAGGTGAVSLRAAARRVGVSPQATYNHFRDKAALLAAAAEEGVRALERSLQAARAAGGDAGERLEAIGVAYVTFAASHAAHFRLLGAPELADKAAHPRLLAAYQDAFAVLAQSIEECQRAGVVRGGDTRRLAMTAWATVHGVACLLIDAQLTVAGVTADPARAARDAVRTLGRGLTARRERRPPPTS